MIPAAVVAFVLLAAVAAFFRWRLAFLRDPARKIPPGDSVLAPADGLIVYVKRVKRGQVPTAIKGRAVIPLKEMLGLSDGAGADGWLIGTFLTPMSVHRQRSPVSGEVVVRHYKPSPFNISMLRIIFNRDWGIEPWDKDCGFLLQNERLTIGVDTGRGVVYVTQIAGCWINRILAWVDVGTRLARGQQYGLIRFGSQVDLFVPDSLGVEIVAARGRYVYAGETVFAVKVPNPVLKGAR